MTDPVAAVGETVAVSVKSVPAATELLEEVSEVVDAVVPAAAVAVMLTALDVLDA